MRKKSSRAGIYTIVGVGFLYFGSFGQDSTQTPSEDVNIGYSTVKQENLTGSVISIKGDEITKDAVFSFRKALQGRAAGVNIIQNSGQPGKNMTVRIRGVGTINYNAPLYIVDGIQMSNIDFINLYDIESIAILKDASASAIYGGQGMNGVVIVTTKSGKEGVSKVTYDMYIGMSQPWKKPSLCNAEQWAWLNNLARRNSGDTAVINHPFPGFNNPSSFGAGTDWWDECMRSGLIQSHTVSVSKGDDKLKYYLSAGYFNQEGILKGSDYQRAHFRFNAENKIADWISIGDNLGIARVKHNNSNESDEWNSVMINILCMHPTIGVFDSTGKNYTSDEPYGNVKNPAGIIAHNNSTNLKTSIMGAVYGNINLFNVLKLKSKFGLDMRFNDSSAFFPKFYSGSNDNNSNAVVARKTEDNHLWNFENTISYQGQFAEVHSLKLVAGINAQENNSDFIFAQNSGTASNDSAMRYLSATTSTFSIKRGLKSGNSLTTFLGDWNTITRINTFSMLHFGEMDHLDLYRKTAGVIFHQERLHGRYPRNHL